MKHGIIFSLGLLFVGVLLTSFQEVLAKNMVQVLGNSTSQYWIWVDEEGNIKRDDQARTKQNFFSGTTDSFQKSEDDFTKNSGLSLEDENQEELKNIGIEKTNTEEKKHTDEENPEENNIEYKYPSLAKLGEEENSVMTFTQKWGGEKKDEDQEVELEESVEEEKSEEEKHEENKEEKTEIKFTKSFQLHDNQGNITTTVLKTLDDERNIITLEKELYDTDEEGNIIATVKSLHAASGEEISTARYEYEYIEGEKILTNKESKYSAVIKGKKKFVTENYIFHTENNTSVIEKNILTEDQKIISSETYKYINIERDTPVLKYYQQKNINDEGKVTTSLTSQIIYDENTGTREKKINTLYAPYTQQTITQTLVYQEKNLKKKITNNREEENSENSENDEQIITEKKYTLSDKDGKIIKSYTEKFLYDPDTNKKIIQRTLHLSNGDTTTTTSPCSNVFSL